MRFLLALVTAALVSPSSVWAAEPPITFQTHAIDRVLDDLRAAADLIGGEKAVKAVNRSIKDTLGEKGFEGIDLSRSVVGYLILAPNPEDIVLVVALPVTGEKEFLAFCDRVNKEKHKALGNGLYQLPPLEPRHQARMRFSDGYAYIAAGLRPEPALAPKALVPLDKLYDPAERAIVTTKFHFDRLTPELKKSFLTYLAEAKKQLTDKKPNEAVESAWEKAAPEIEKMYARYLTLLEGTGSAAMRLSVDVPTGDLALEATLSGRPGTPLAQEIAGRKPSVNKFAGLLTPDTAAGFTLRLPFFSPELRGAAVVSLEEGQKAAVKEAEEVAKPLTDELFKGLIRTVKSGEVDLVGAVRGPDKAGAYSVVVGAAFDAPAGFEKEFRKYVEKEAPEDERKRITWGTAAPGKVAVHTYTPGPDIGEPVRAHLGGDKCVVAFAFAPHGVIVVVGPDAAAAVAAAAVAKPAESAVFELVLNPARMAKLVGAFAPVAGADVERALGNEDKLMSAVSLRVRGGKELSVRLAVNLRLFPRAIASATGGSDEPEPPPPQKDEKKP